MTIRGVYTLLYLLLYKDAEVRATVDSMAKPTNVLTLDLSFQNSKPVCFCLEMTQTLDSQQYKWIKRRVVTTLDKLCFNVEGIRVTFSRKGRAGEWWLSFSPGDFTTEQCPHFKAYYSILITILPGPKTLFWSCISTVLKSKLNALIMPQGEKK